MGQITVATTAEVSQNVTKNSKVYNEKINKDLIKDAKVQDPERFKKEVLAVIEEVNKIPEQEIDNYLKQAKEYNKVQDKISTLDTQLKNHNDVITKINETPDASLQQQAEMKNKYIKETGMTKGAVKKINKDIQSLRREGGELRPPKVGDRNMHALKGDRTSQLALDLKEADPITGRKDDRILVEKVRGKLVFVDYTSNHDYKSCEIGVKKLIHEPFDAIRPEHINRDLFDDEEIGLNDKKND